VNRARWDLCGGRSAMGVPTAIKPVHLTGCRPGAFEFGYWQKVAHEDPVLEQMAIVVHSMISIFLKRVEGKCEIAKLGDP